MAPTESHRQATNCDVLPPCGTNRWRWLFANWRSLIEQFDQRSSCWNNGLSALDDILRSEVFSIESLIGVLIGIHGSSFQRHASKQPLGTRVCQNVCTHGGGVVGSRLSARRARSGRSIRAELSFAVQYLIGTLLVHNH